MKVASEREANLTDPLLITGNSQEQSVFPPLIWLAGKQEKFIAYLSMITTLRFSHRAP